MILLPLSKSMTQRGYHSSQLSSFTGQCQARELAPLPFASGCSLVLIRYAQFVLPSFRLNIVQVAGGVDVSRILCALYILEVSSDWDWEAPLFCGASATRSIDMNSSVPSDCVTRVRMVCVFPLSSCFRYVMFRTSCDV